MKRVVLAGIVLAAVALMIAPTAANATSIVFGIASGCGSGTPCGQLNVSSSSANGFNIRIGSVTISGAPTASANGTFGVTSSLTNLGGFGDLAFDSVANTISITGAISGLGVAQETLLSGSFSSFNILNFTSTTGQISGSGPDTKSADLLAAIGLPTGTQFNFFGFVLGFNKTAPLGSYDPVNASIVNQTPEPGTLMLFGSGLLSLMGLLKRKVLTQA